MEASLFSEASALGEHDSSRPDSYSVWLPPRRSPMRLGFSMDVGVPLLARASRCRVAHGVARHGKGAQRWTIELTRRGWRRVEAPLVGTAIVDEGKVVRPSQLIASVRRTRSVGRGQDD